MISKFEHVFVANLPQQKCISNLVNAFSYEMDRIVRFERWERNSWDDPRL
jgi:hypothetical protein